MSLSHPSPHLWRVVSRWVVQRLSWSSVCGLRNLQMMRRGNFSVCDMLAHSLMMIHTLLELNPWQYSPASYMINWVLYIEEQANFECPQAYRWTGWWTECQWHCALAGASLASPQMTFHWQSWGCLNLVSQPLLHVKAVWHSCERDLILRNG